jgi:hypothetical protein
MNNRSSLSSDTTTLQQAGFGPPVRARDVVFLICWLLACGGLMFWRSFHVAYSFDDIAHLHALAAFRSGEITFTTWLFLQHNEHIVPLLRLYFMAATKISGLSSAAMHVLIFLNYALGAFSCAWILFSFTRSRLGAFLAGTIFVSAGGFAGSIVWQPTDAQFSVAGTPLILATAILVSACARKRWTDALVLLLIVVSAMGMGAMAVAALSIPIYLFLAKPETMAPARRKLMIALSVLLSAALLLATRWMMYLHFVHGPKFAIQGVYDGLFLVFVTPGRFLLAWTPFAELSLPLDIVAALVGWLLLILSWRWVSKPLRSLLIALWMGNGLLAVLIGIGRYAISTYADFFATDRYHYFFLLPLALQVATALDHLTGQLLQGANPSRKNVTAGVLACLMLAALVMSHIRLDHQMLWAAIDQHQLEFREAKVLAKVVKATAARQNLHLEDGPIRFPGDMNLHLALSCIIFTQFPKGLPGVQWSLSSTPTASVGWPYNVLPISDADAAVQNQIFDEWAKKLNRPPYTCVIGGKIQDVLPVNSCAEAAKLSPPPIAPPRPFN